MKPRNQYGFYLDDVERNTLVKKLGGLLPAIDPRIEWVDYVPGTAVKTNTPLVVVGYADKVRYVDVKGLSPFKMINEVMNALDDYHPQVQFLSERKLAVIEDDLERLAMDRMEVTDEALRILARKTESDGKKRYLLSKSDCSGITKLASEMEILPMFFPDKEVLAGRNVLSEFLRHNRATFMDTQMLTDMLREKEKLRVRDLEGFREENDHQETSFSSPGEMVLQEPEEELEL